MKLKRIQFYLYITVALIIIIFSCQKKNNDIIVTKNTKKEVEKLIAIADTFYDNQKFDSAFYYYNKVKFICNPKTDTENFVSTLNRMADIQQNQGDYSGSESTVTEAIPYLKHIKNPKHAWNTYTILGINYINTYDYENALFYFNKTLLLKTTEWRKSAAKNNIAYVLILQKKYNEALQVFLPLLSTNGVKKFPEDHARALDNIGYCYFSLGDPKALPYLTKALEIRIKTKDIAGIGRSYFNLAKFYQKNNSVMAMKYLKLSYEKYTIINSVEDRLSTLQMLIENSDEKESKKYALKYIRINDSITVIKQKLKNEFAKVKYDFKKEKDENIKLKTNKTENELQLERQRNRNIVSYIIIVFSLCLILILYFYLTSRSNKEKIEATYQSETRISKKLHDELANDIYHTMAFAENKNLSIIENKEQLLNHLDAIYFRTRDISKENSPIITTEKYLFYLKEMISGFDTSNINLLITGLDTISWEEIDRNKKIAVYRVLQELLVNMKKHSNATLVGITFKKAERNIIINYADNGIGVNLDNVSFKNGLHNAENRIQAIKGEITFDAKPDKGFKVSFKFPVR
ncbi:histidine kinase/DNA gyrase B/HSP90-like ATPase [Flavobacterium chryseum]|uniref:tetratricopeptide repeat-containing sensor histidine kinase n=1 Tax=Flavobacterium sp. P3160 TaxID=2512113 RepID=UPI0010D99772|nr:ATP-binding protein [Flavobacterium sp. P3160]TDO68805.1 histidine kinase/DNA gyrase B/HSP90-like ATPase [Flavobacterium sp. P3160]